MNTEYLASFPGTTTIGGRPGPTIDGLYVVSPPNAVSTVSVGCRERNADNFFEVHSTSHLVE
jgi:hypothetical protein